MFTTLSKRIPHVNELNVLIEFSASRAISEHTITSLHEKYIDKVAASVVGSNIRIDKLNSEFKKYGQLMQEIYDILSPGVYLRTFQELSLSVNQYEIPFTRFIIMTHIFGSQHIIDTIYDFFSLLLQNSDIKLSVTMFSFHFEKIVTVLLEYDDLLKNSTSLKILKSRLNVEDRHEWSIQDIIYLGIKYPILFYSLSKFQKLFQRVYFGTKYWSSYSENSKLESKPRLDIDLSNIHLSNIQLQYENEKNVLIQTSRSLIFDTIQNYKKPMTLTIKQPKSDQLSTISYQNSIILKQVLGNRLASRLVQESEMILDFIPIPGIFTEYPMPNNSTLYEYDVHYETTDGYEFSYNIATGKKSWIKKIINVNGNTIKKWESLGN